jgi:mercuric ion transport protein
MRRVLGLGAGAVVSGIAAALCCAGPLLAVVGGAGAVALASVVEPYRNVFLLVAAGSLSAGFAIVRRDERNSRVPGASCASGTQRRWARRLLILGTIVTILAASYPFWSVWF